MEKVNIKEVSTHSKEQLQQNHDTMKYIMKQVIEMRTISRCMCICDENMLAEESTWSSCLKKL